MEPKLVCGIDEVGRGCLAGPIISVAAVFYWGHVDVAGVNDSKKLNAQRRENIFERLLRSPYLVDFGIGQVSVDEINAIGIDNANLKSFILAVTAVADNLPAAIDLLIVDGQHPVPSTAIPQTVEPKADGTYPVVSAASILAKVIRDRHMTEMDSVFPGYNWTKNKGYGTEDHREALRQHGPCVFHRKKFVRNICPNGVRT